MSTPDSRGRSDRGPDASGRGVLETRVRAELRAEADTISPSGDSWQQNLRRVQAARRRRGRGMLGVAATVTALLVLAGAVALLDDGRTAGGVPADGRGASELAGDPWDPGNIRGEPVMAETLTLDGVPTRHEIVLTDTTGDGPDLCDRYLTDGGSGGGCTTRDPDADDPTLAFDWLSGTEGAGDIRGVLGGVDRRVSFVEVWMSAGEVVRPTLHPTGWDDTRMFAVTVPADGPRPQRLVASGRDGNVLEAVDLGQRFSGPAGWLPPEPGCAGGVDDTGIRYLLPPDGLDSAVARLGFGAASVRVATADPAETPCLDLAGSSVAATTVIGDVVVVITGPEVARLLLFDGRREVAMSEAQPRPVPGTPWRIATAVLKGDTDGASVTAFDRSGSQVDQQVLNRQAQP